MSTRILAVPPPDAGSGRSGARFAVPRAVSPQPVPPDPSLDHPSLYFNHELSWLHFNWRVLHQVIDERNPLLERVRFLAIVQSNLDEFFRKRVGGLKRQLGAGVRRLSPDGRTPAQQLEMIRAAVIGMQEAMTRLWKHELRPRLAREARIVVRDYGELDRRERRSVHAHFRSTIYPILTPLAVDPGHPFPFISNMSLSLAVVLRPPDGETRRFARVKIPTQQGRWVPLDAGGVLPVEEVVRRHVDELFPGMVVEAAHLFRLTRNADIRRNEEEAEDLLQMISAELRERRFAPVVRLEVEESMPADVRDLLCRELELAPEDVYEIDGLLDLAGLRELTGAVAPEHRFDPWEPVIPPRLEEEGETEDAPDIFAVIRAGDLLVHHPYDSFNASVLRLLEEAADDPQVLAIKQTLYRTSRNSPVVRALIRAAESGKQVAVLVEVTARFDEQNNIEWAQMLEKSGVHVTYGLVGLKTHAKVMLIVRQEGGRIRTYCHIGTGNYHTETAHQYSDVGLITCDPEIGADVVNLFHHLTGYAPDQHYDHLIVAPRDMRRRFEALIDREIEQQRQHGDGRIIAKMNALDDVDIIQRLYQASREGVRIDLVVRGHTRLRPGLDGVSENIRVVSIIGRFLEHDRIFYFHNHGQPELYIGSADWRRRNLEDRVEAVVQVTDPVACRRIVRLLHWALRDNRLAWDLHPDGRYTLRQPEEGQPERNFHEWLMQDARERSAARRR